MTTKRLPEERGFGLSAGGALLALGGWWLFRGKFPLLAPLFLASGGLLVLLGAALPGALAVPRRLWMSLAEGLGFVTTCAVLLAVFALVVTPVGLLRRLTGADPLRRRTPAGGSAWHPCPARHLDSRHYERLF